MAYLALQANFPPSIFTVLSHMYLRGWNGRSPCRVFPSSLNSADLYRGDTGDKYHKCLHSSCSSIQILPIVLYLIPMEDLLIVCLGLEMWEFLRCWIFAKLDFGQHNLIDGVSLNFEQLLSPCNRN